MFGSLRDKLARTREAFRRVEDLFRSGKRREEILDGLEEALLLADVGVTASTRVLEALRTGTRKDAGEAELGGALKAELEHLLSPGADGRPAADAGPAP
ncbi:MAG TPA: signal recognition particle receptor subunit alpha, partial [Acidobacteriota bacterium]|nr:signal recognition particle receptor subunit alpha [Acidobacteriota bacterium]